MDRNNPGFYVSFSTSTTVLVCWKYFIQKSSIKPLINLLNIENEALFAAVEDRKHHHSLLALSADGPSTSDFNFWPSCRCFSAAALRSACTYPRCHINHRRSLLTGCYSFYYPSYTGFITASYHLSEMCGHCCRNLIPCDETNAHLSVEVRGGEAESIMIPLLLKVRARCRWTHETHAGSERVWAVNSNRGTNTEMKHWRADVTIHSFTS